MNTKQQVIELMNNLIINHEFNEDSYPSFELYLAEANVSSDLIPAKWIWDAHVKSVNEVMSELAQVA